MIVLSEAISEITKNNRVFDEWREFKGIKYKVVYNKGNRSRSIVVICPRCGMVGNLVRVTLRSRRGYRVVHYPGKKGCHFGWCQPEYDILKELYHLVRGGRF